MTGYYKEGVMYEGVTMEQPRKRNFHAEGCRCVECQMFIRDSKKLNELLASAPRLTAIGFEGEGVREYEMEKQTQVEVNVDIGCAWEKATDKEYEQETEFFRRVVAIPVQEPTPRCQ